MLLGGKGGCQQCTCVPCDACTRTCQNPYTGTEFEVVFTRYFEGAEAGNTSDGYLTASGDSDTSDPYDGMDGSGPWYQQITGSFTVNSTQTRFPCRVLVSLWRNNYTLGAATIPPASTALTSEKVYVTVTDGAVVVGDLVIVPADGEVETTFSVPLVSGSGDQSGNDPRFYEGSVFVAPQCESASFSIRARIEWNTQKRQHVLYGLVRECYEIGTPCATACSGSAPPSTIYLEIKNVSLSGGATVAGLAGTYVMTRVPNYCGLYEHFADLTCSIGFFFGHQEALYASSTVVTTIGQSMRRVFTIDGVAECAVFTLHWFNETPVPICGTGVIKSGNGGTITVANGAATTGTFDWEITA